MNYRTFGRTGIKVSELVLGGGNVGGIFIHADEAISRQALRRALDAGINWIDTAPQYGDGVSETRLGKLLGEISDDPVISTKVRLKEDELGDIPSAIEASLQASLERLQRSSVHVLQLHNVLDTKAQGGAVTPDHVLQPGGVVEAFERLREKGLIQASGFTAKGDSECCRKVAESGLLDSVQVYYNLLNPSAGQDMPPKWMGQNFAGLLAAAQGNEMGIMCIRVLAAGVIATDQRHGRESVIALETEIGTEEKNAKAVFAALGDAFGTRAQTAVRFCLANENVSCVNVGFSEISHLDEAVAAVEMGPLPPEAIETLNGLYETGFGAA